MRSIPSLVLASGVAAIAAALSGCGGNQSSSPWVSPQTINPQHAHRHSGSSKIQHVVVIIQENRSLNNLFYNFPGATTVSYGYNSKGAKVTLEPVALEAKWDLEHDAEAFFEACNGTGSIPGTDCQMNGFNREWVGCGHASGPKCPYTYPQYAYVPPKEIGPYITMGKQYVLADQMYASNLDASSFVAHQYLIAAQAAESVNYPTGLWGCPGGSGDTISEIGQQRQVPDGSELTCFNDTTLGQEADNAGVTWAYYTAGINRDGQIWSAYQANQHVYYGSDWKNDIITPQTKFFNDVSNGNLRQISWVTPTYENSDHPNAGSNTGPMWVASIVNAIGQSQYWDNTAIFILWDDYGGWFDPEPPAYADYDGLGMRIPMLVVSAYAKQGHVSHVHYELGSILKFIEDQFGLPRLSASDTRASSPASDCFDFNQSPRPFQTIPSALKKEYFIREPLDLRPPDNR